MAEGGDGGGGQGLFSDFNETEGFEDYDPDPYDGGYDIAKTYGQPLPPSPAICYPVDGGVPRTPPPAAAADGPPSPAPQVLVAPTPRRKEGQVVEEIKEASAHPNGDETDLPSRRCCCRKYVEKCRFWDGKRGFPQWAVDYLFEHLPFYGKKRDETLSYANLNYAYERHAFQEPVTVMIDPSVEEFYPQKEGCDFYENQRYEKEKNQYGSLRYSDACEEQDYPLLEHSNAYGRQRYEKTWSVDVEPAMTERLSYHEGFKGEGYPLMVHESSYDGLYENHDNSVEVYPGWSGGLSYSDVYQDGIFSLTEYVNAYERQTYGNSISIEVEPPETREVTYHGTLSKGEDDPLEFSSAYQKQRYDKFFPYEPTYPGDYTQTDSPVLDYVSAFEKQSYENSVSVEIDPDLTGRLGHNEANQDGIYSLFQYVDPYEKNRYGQPAAVEVEAIKHSWSSCADYHKDYWGKMDHHGEGMYPVENNSYEKHSNVPLEPYEPTLSWDFHQDTYQQERPSQHKYDGGPEEYGAWSSWLFD